MHEKRRLELIIERMALRRAQDILEEIGVTGYTIVNATAGFGGGRRWRRSGNLSSADEMVVVIAIGDEAKITEAVDKLGKLFEAQIGILSVSTVEVLRPDRF